MSNSGREASVAPGVPCLPRFLSLPVLTSAALVSCVCGSVVSGGWRERGRWNSVRLRLAALC